MKAIVSGHHGFIGSRLMKNLKDNNDSVYGIDNFHTHKLTGIPVKGDVKSYDYLDILDEKIDIFYHLGIPSSSPMYRDDNSLYWRTIRDFLQILDYCKTNQVKLVFASSSSVYNGNPSPWNERMLIKPMDYYTECRYEMERLAELYYYLYGMSITALRLFSVYGPGEEHKKIYANIVTQFLWDMRRNKSPVIYGDGKQSRDFVYVDDVVEAFKLGGNKNGFNVFNVGTGIGCSFNQIIKKLNIALGTDIRPTYEDSKTKNYIDETLADISLAQKELRFKAKVSIDEGISNICEYYL